MASKQRPKHVVSLNNKTTKTKLRCDLLKIHIPSVEQKVLLILLNP